MRTVFCVGTNILNQIGDNTCIKYFLSFTRHCRHCWCRGVIARREWSINPVGVDLLHRCHSQYQRDTFNGYRLLWPFFPVAQFSVAVFSIALFSFYLGDCCTAVDQVLQSLVLQTAMHCDSQFVVDMFRDVEPVQFLVQQVWQAVVELGCASDETCCSVQYTLQLVSNVDNVKRGNS